MIFIIDNNRFYRLVVAALINTEVFSLQTHPGTIPSVNLTCMSLGCGSYLSKSKKVSNENSSSELLVTVCLCVCVYYLLYVYT